MIITIIVLSLLIWQNSDPVGLAGLVFLSALYPSL